MKKVRPFTLWGIIGLLIFLLIIQGITLRSEINKTSSAASTKSTCTCSSPFVPSAPMTRAFARSIVQDYLDNNLEQLVEAAVSKEVKQNMRQSTESTVQNRQKNPEQETSSTSLLADEAIKLYLSGDWNGFPCEMEEHLVTLSDKGRLYVDGNSSRASLSTGVSHSIDLPEAMSDFIGQRFILGDGTYRIERNTLVKYSHGKQIPLSGGSLVWEGMDLENYRPYDVDLYYDKVYDKLFIIASSIPYDFSSRELKNGASIYLYVVPDRDVSEIEFISEITKFDFDEAGLFYSDTSDTIWRYYEKEGQCYVKKSKDTSLAVRDIEKIGYFMFSLRCAFADGYIHEKEPFPDGTFTHPVVTTPSVALSEYSD